MIDIKKYIDPDLIVADLKAKTKVEAIRELAEKLLSKRPACIDKNLTVDQLTEKAMDRENVQSTGLGSGLAFPHARIEQCSEFACVIGYSSEGIDFKSRDGQKAHLICLMVSCIGKPYIILQVMASLARFISEEGLELQNKTMTQDQIHSLLFNNISVTRKQILARDIMRPTRKTINIDDSVQNAARVMHLNHIDILPVVDQDGNLMGEVSCLDIFRYGIPDFFNQLQTVSFVKHIDPFEKFFKFQKELLIKDIYNHRAPSVNEDITLMEIIFEMTVKNHAVLYVVDDGKLTGIIDRFSIIDKILFF